MVSDDESEEDRLGCVRMKPLEGRRRIELSHVDQSVARRKLSNYVSIEKKFKYLQH